MNQVIAKSTSNVNTPPKEGERELSWYVRTKFALVRCFLWGWASLFSLKGLYLLGQAFGTLEYLINFKRRTRYLRAVRRLFPEGIEPRRMRRYAHAYFRRVRCDKLFYLVIDKLPQEKILHRIRWHGRELVDAALARGRGMFLLMSHIGSNHVTGQLMALMGYEVAGIRDRNEGAARIYMQRKLSETFPLIAQNLRIFYADDFPRVFYRHLQENKMLGASLDISRFRGENLKTCPVRIFGETREWLTGTLQIALRCRTVIGTLLLVSRPNFYFRMIVAPLYSPDTPEGENLDTPELVAELMQRYADGIEAQAREYPDHLSRI